MPARAPTRRPTRCGRHEPAGPPPGRCPEGAARRVVRERAARPAGRSTPGGARVTGDPFGLQRFVDAQEGVIDQALAELRAGAKRSHWMWFVFPQLRGLGRSVTARHYGIASRDEALAYWRHPVLGPRLKACADALRAHGGRTLAQILGSPDDLKLVSSMTLFDAVVPDEPVFGQVLALHAAGRRDPLTRALLREPLHDAPPDAPAASRSFRGADNRAGTSAGSSAGTTDGGPSHGPSGAPAPST